MELSQQPAPDIQSGAMKEFALFASLMGQASL
jgi:hypothetical protein